jgi:hypothetical protein
MRLANGREIDGLWEAGQPAGSTEAVPNAPAGPQN